MQKKFGKSKYLACACVAALLGLYGPAKAIAPESGLAQNAAGPRAADKRIRVAEAVGEDDPSVVWKAPYDPAPSASFITRDRSIKPMLLYVTARGSV